MQSVSFKWVLWQNWLKVIQSSDRVYLYFCTCKSFPLLSGRNTFSGRGLWNCIHCKDRNREVRTFFVFSAVEIVFLSVEVTSSGETRATNQSECYMIEYIHGPFSFSTFSVLSPEVPSMLYLYWKCHTWSPFWPAVPFWWTASALFLACQLHPFPHFEGLESF